MSASARWRASSASAARPGRRSRETTRRSRPRAEIGYPVLVRPSYVLGGRAMRICDDENDLRAAMAARQRLRARRPVRRERDRDRCRRALRRRGRLHRRGDAARRGGGRSLGRLLVRAAGAVAHARERARGRARRPPARPRTRGRRAAERPARDRRLDGLRPRGEPARVAHGAVREQGDRPSTSSRPRAVSRTATGSTSWRCRRRGRPR